MNGIAIDKAPLSNARHGKPILRGFVAKVCGASPFKVSQILAHENLSKKSQTLLTDVPGWFQSLSAIRNQRAEFAVCAVTDSEFPEAGA